MISLFVFLFCLGFWVVITMTPISQTLSEEEPFMKFLQQRHTANGKELK